VPVGGVVSGAQELHGLRSRLCQTRLRVDPFTCDASLVLPLGSGSSVLWPPIANMSLGGTASSSVDTATNNLINDGVATAVAAGNGTG
jgi:hypothetical protein